MIIDHKNKAYIRLWGLAGKVRYNGAYYYSEEIVKNIIPRVKTDRNWTTINIKGVCEDHSIVFIHNNMYPGLYNWLKDYKDLILVCGVPETCEKMKRLGKAVYLPLSVDVKEVQAYKCKKTKDTAFAGRLDKKVDIPDGVDVIAGLPRSEFLAEMAKYKKIYAVGRTAIEAKILGCEVLPYDPRYPDPDVWQVLDNKDAAKMLQALIDDVDKPVKKPRKRKKSSKK